MKEQYIEEMFDHKLENGDICRCSMFYFLDNGESHYLENRRASSKFHISEDFSESEIITYTLENGGWNRDVLCRKIKGKWVVKLYPFLK